MKKRNIICGILGGLILYIPLLFSTYAFHFIENPILVVGTYLLTALLSLAVTAFVLLYKNRSPRSAMIRSLLVSVLALVLILLDRLIAHPWFTESVLHLTQSDFDKQVSDLILSVHWIWIDLVCFACVFLLPIFNRLAKGYKEYREKEISASV